MDKNRISQHESIFRIYDRIVADKMTNVWAPEYMEQKATIDAVFALALGLYTYVNPVPNVTGAPNLVRLLTQELSSVTGGLLDIEKDATKAADNLLGHILTKRDKLGI